MTQASREQARREALRVSRAAAEPRAARITGYDPDTHKIKVVLLPEGDFPLNPGDTGLTDWIPFGTAASGNGFGIYCGPALGDQVMVVHQENDHGAPWAIARINDTNNPAPAGVQSGEIWILSKSGSLIKMTNDNKMSINGQLEIDMTGPTINITAGAGPDGAAPVINITTASGGTINIEAPEGTVAISGQTITLTASGGPVAISGDGVTVAGGAAPVALTGSNVTANGTHLA